MEIGESAAVEVIADSNHDDDCYFCNAKDKPAEETNDLTDKFEEDSDLDGSLEEVKFKNDSGTLGGNIGGDQGKRSVTVPGTKARKTLVVSVAAHHLIPGNASLAKSELFKCKKYLHVDKKAPGNIGYNVNSAPNGVWLPGNYAARPWGTKGAAFQKDFGPSPQQYANAAIQVWRAQFHDAHEAYSDFVMKVLNKLYQKLKAGEDLTCPEGKKRKDKKPEESSPLYVLVARLDTVSSRMRRMLVAPSTNWKKNVWTSSLSLSYMSDKTTPHIKS
jgi:hypothetical protein